MALPIGLAVLRATIEITCGRCQRKQLRAAGIAVVRCKFCHRPLPVPPTRPRR